MQGDFFISRADVDGIPTLSVSGDVDFTTSPELSRELREAVNEGHSTVDVDLSGVRFFDSSGARVLLNAWTEAGRIRLKGASPSVRRVLEVLLERRPPFYLPTAG